MFSLTEQGFSTIQEAFPEADMVRLGISPRGCGAPFITVSPGEAKTSDTVIEDKGIRLCIDTALYQEIEAVSLDAVNGRFVVDMKIPVTVAGCGLCPASPLQGGTCGIIEGRNF